MCKVCAARALAQRKAAGITVKVSDKKKENLRKAFPWISWDFESLIIVDEGYGDRPQFSIVGTYKTFCIEYLSQGCGGTAPWITFYRNEKEVLRTRGQANDSTEIKKKVDLI